jgi:hypothetical protein
VNEYELQEYLDLFGIKKPWPRDGAGRPVPSCTLCEKHPVAPRKVPATKRLPDGTPYCNPCGRWVE